MSRQIQPPSIFTPTSPDVGKFVSVANVGGVPTFVPTAVAPGDGPVGYTAENKSTGTLAAGAAVGVHVSGRGVVRARADVGGTPCVGLLAAALDAAVAGTVCTDGPLTLNDWSAALDTGATELTPKAHYFLSAAQPAQLTASPPAAGGQYVQRVGYALSADTLSVEVGDPILL